MKYNQSNIIGDAGEHLVAAQVIKLFNFPCRLVNIDIGIDAEIEIIDDNYKSTGEFIKAQIKTTNSDKLHLYLDGEHISYWNKINIPVVIFLVHLHSEKIYWHCIDNLAKYLKSDSGYKVEFKKSDILKKKNLNNFKNIAVFPLEQQIIKSYNEAYDTVVKDNQYLDTDNYDLTTFENFVIHANKIIYDFNKVDKLITKNQTLKILLRKNARKLEVIQEYLNRIEEEKESILLDSGENYFDHLNSEKFNWD